MSYLEIVFNNISNKTLYRNNIIKNFKMLEKNLSNEKFINLKQIILPFLNTNNEFKIIIKDNNFEIINIHDDYIEKNETTFIELDLSEDYEDYSSDDEVSIIYNAELANKNNNIS